MSLLTDRLVEHAAEVSGLPAETLAAETGAAAVVFDAEAWAAGIRRLEEIAERLEAINAMSDAEVIAKYRPDLLQEIQAPAAAGGVR
ncbi:hypothetical protein [Frankia sp. AvcI1]|uniref:hypothetical protein n=1 Tax=Frankia sp. AvcI1 TaxID=573496 RepID=UPI00211969DB|nr:hypothetical protein [Frankia sp. AvcI1]